MAPDGSSGYDRVRRTEIGKKNIKLRYFEEVRAPLSRSEHCHLIRDLTKAVALHHWCLFGLGEVIEDCSSTWTKEASSNSSLDSLPHDAIFKKTRHSFSKLGACCRIEAFHTVVCFRFHNAPLNGANLLQQLWAMITRTITGHTSRVR